METTAQENSKASNQPGQKIYPSASSAMYFRIVHGTLSDSIVFSHSILPRARRWRGGVTLIRITPIRAIRLRIDLTASSTEKPGGITSGPICYRRMAGRRILHLRFPCGSVGSHFRPQTSITIIEKKRYIDYILSLFSQLVKQSFNLSSRFAKYYAAFLVDGAAATHHFSAIRRLIWSTPSRFQRTAPTLCSLNLLTIFFGELGCGFPYGFPGENHENSPLRFDSRSRSQFCLLRFQYNGDGSFAGSCAYFRHEPVLPMPPYRQRLTPPARSVSPPGHMRAQSETRLFRVYPQIEPGCRFVFQRLQDQPFREGQTRL